MAARLDKTVPLETAAQIQAGVIEVMELANDGILDVARSRVREQEVLEVLDEQPPTR